MSGLRTKIASESRPKFVLDKPAFKTVLNPDETVFLQCYKIGSGILFRFSDIADFHYDPATRDIKTHPVAGTDDETISHLYINQVMPLVKSAHGQLVLHACSMEIKDAAVLFLGKSGVGKSTLATHFARNNYRLICEDGAELCERDNRFHVKPGHNSIRLLSDSRHSLLGSQTDQSIGSEVFGKFRVSNPDWAKFADTPMPISAIFHIQEAESEVISLNTLSPRQALSSGLEHMFLLDDQDKAVLSGQFEQLARLSNELPNFALSYPRNFGQLKEVAREIVDHCSGMKA